MIYGVKQLPYIIFSFKGGIFIWKADFSGNYEADIASLNLRLRVSESFDLVSRQIMIGSHRAMLWFIDGFIKDGLMEKS